MAWDSVSSDDVQAGDRVRLANGQELLVSRIERDFMGMDSMVAFIEDTPERWFKQPVPKGTALEVERG